HSVAASLWSSTMLTSSFGFMYGFGYPRALHPFPTRRSSDLSNTIAGRYLSIVFLAPRRTSISAPSTSIFRSDGASPNTSSGLTRSEEHTSELQSRFDLVCRLLLEKI